MADLSKVKNLYHEFRDHWSKPAPGKFVPYREYGSVLLGCGGDYALRNVMGKLSFGTGCWLVVFYYQIPLLTFSIIGTFFLVQGYFWAIINMIIADNLGYLPKKTERALYLLHAFFTVLGLITLLLDFSKIIPFPAAVINYANTLPGMDLRCVLKIFGAHWLVVGWGGVRGIFIRKKWLKKLGRFKLFAYTNVIQNVTLSILICWLPLYQNPMSERIWQLFLLFTMRDMFGYNGSCLNVSYLISPNAHERMLVRCYPEKLSHIFNSILVDTVFPIVAAFTGGMTNVNTFKYVIPVMMILFTVLMFKGMSNIQERIPQPPVEKKKYIPFWEGINGVLKNKYRWINAISGMIDALGNGTVSIFDVIFIYSWREQGLVFVIFKNLIAFVGNPGAFLAPWIRKRFSYKSMVVFKRLVFAAQSAGYIFACTVFRDNYYVCGGIMLVTILIGDFLTSAIKLADDDMNARINDYQMYLSGERLENFGGVVSWLTNPVSSIISLIIPILYYMVGFNSDYDILFCDDIRMRCVVIGVTFDLVGHILCFLPYIFFWDYTDEKHEKVMKVLELREKIALEGATQEEIYAITIEDIEAEEAKRAAAEQYDVSTS